MWMLTKIFGAITILAGLMGAWIIWTTVTQSDVMAPALAASAATAAAITIIPYCIMRVFEMLVSHEPPPPYD